MSSFKETGGSGRHGTGAGESTSRRDDSNSTDPKQVMDPRPDPAESGHPAAWLLALNSFLERAFLKADVDTGC